MTVSKICLALGLQKSFPLDILMEMQGEAANLRELKSLFAMTFTQSFRAFGAKDGLKMPISCDNVNVGLGC
jgi:hypothetical protein